MRKRSKHPYRAVQLRKLDGSIVVESVEGQDVVVGIDVAKEAMVAAVLDDVESIVKTIRWSHPKETDQFIGFLCALRARSADWS